MPSTQWVGWVRCTTRQRGGLGTFFQHGLLPLQLQGQRAAARVAAMSSLCSACACLDPSSQLADPPRTSSAVCRACCRTGPW